MPAFEDDLLYDTLSSVHEAVLDCEVVDENDARPLHEFHLRCEAVEALFTQLHALFLRNTAVFGIDTNNGQVFFVRHRSQVCLVVCVAIFLWIFLSRSSEVHDHGCIGKAGALSERKLAALASAEPVVVFAGPVQVT